MPTCTPTTREDFPLRTDAQWLFQEVGIDAAHLVFADEVDLGALDAEARLAGLVLVDHNVLSAKPSDLNPRWGGAG